MLRTIVWLALKLGEVMKSDEIWDVGSLQTGGTSTTHNALTQELGGASTTQAVTWLKS
jgi:hypothetical protein